MEHEKLLNHIKELESELQEEKLDIVTPLIAERNKYRDAVYRAISIFNTEKDPELRSNLMCKELILAIPPKIK